MLMKLSETEGKGTKMGKIKVGDKFVIDGSEGKPVYICVSVERSKSGEDFVYGRPVGSLFVSVRVPVDCFVKDEKKV